MDGRIQFGNDVRFFIYCFANHIDNATEGFVADGNGDGSSCVRALLTTAEAFNGIHCNGTDGIFAKVLSYFENQKKLRCSVVVCFDQQFGDTSKMEKPTKISKYDFDPILTVGQ